MSMAWGGDGSAGIGEDSDGFRRAVRAVLAQARAPEALRARIAAMLAVEARLGP